MYRLNCQLPDEIRERMNPYIERTGVSIASLVSMSLDKFLREDQMQIEMKNLVSNPEFMSKVASTFFKDSGLDMPALVDFQKK